MHGVIFDCLERMILSKYGIEKWEEIKNKANCSVKTGGWVRLEFYPDGLAVALFVSANEVLGINSLLDFGFYWASDFLPFYELENVTICRDRSLKEWINTLNDLHANFKSRLPNFMGPEFYAVNDINDPTGESILVHYYSQRGSLLIPIAVGIITEVAKTSFGLDIIMDQIATQGENESPCTTFRITEKAVPITITSVKSKSNISRVNSNVSPYQDHIVKMKSMASMSSTLTSTSENNDGDASKEIKCPYSGNKLKVSANHGAVSHLTVSDRLHVPKQDISNHVTKSDMRKIPNFSAKQLQDVFPFHLIIDRDFTVIHEGSKLNVFLHNVSCLGKHIEEVFFLKSPKFCGWNWEDIVLNSDASFELHLHPQLQQSELTNESFGNLGLKGGIYILDPEFDSSVEVFGAFFLVNPNFHNFKEMMEHDLTLLDLPRFSFQRDFAFLGEHLYSETSIAHKLELQNRKLDNALEDALQISDAEKKIAKLREDVLLTLPIHQSILSNDPEEKLIKIINNNLSTVLMKDFDGNTAFDLCLTKDSYNRAIYQMVREHLPIDSSTKSEISPDIHGYCWVKVIQSSKYSDIVEIIMDEYINISYELAYSKDSEGRPAINIASPSCQKLIKESLYFFKRYEIPFIDVPQHKSATCTLFLATDHWNNGQLVALKFMAIKEQFEKEKNIRTEGKFSGDFVVDIIRSHESDIDPLFAREIKRKGLTKYPDCVVMPAAERNLQIIISSERVAGRDWQVIRMIATQIAEAIGHMHEKNILHGDIKPLNIMRSDGKMKLIDLDASAILNTGKSGFKSSSAYLPPELLYPNLINNKIEIKRVIYDENNKTIKVDQLPYELVPARYSHDIWSFGVVLYELCSGIKLFLQDDEDNIDEDSLLELFSFSDDFKHKKLAKISNLTARNLVFQLLTKDPLKRPNINQILAHPFISGKNAPRMVGEEAENDVFISYRVNSDKNRVMDLFNTLTSLGLKVWLDSKSLVPGVPWEIGFTDGLLKSRIFLPVISREAINHPTVKSQNLSSLEEDSECDNLLLEWRLALEFLSRGLTARIYPVFIGDVDYNNAVDKDSHLSYFDCKCAPIITKDTVVKSIEEHSNKQLNRLCLGSTMLEELTVNDIITQISKNQGHVVEGSLSEAFTIIHSDILKMNKQLLKQTFVKTNSQKSISIKLPSAIFSVNLDEKSITEFVRFFSECGFDNSKCIKYSETLVLTHNIKSNNELVELGNDTSSLFSLLNKVMSNLDATTVFQIIMTIKKGKRSMIYPVPSISLPRAQLPPLEHTSQREITNNNNSNSVSSFLNSIMSRRSAAADTNNNNSNINNNNNSNSNNNNNNNNNRRRNQRLNNIKSNAIGTKK